MDRTAMTTDPPGLDEATRIFNDATKTAINTEEIIRALLAFAARQPRPITDAMVEAAATVIEKDSYSSWPFQPKRVARAALEAAEKARIAELVEANG